MNVEFYIKTVLRSMKRNSFNSIVAILGLAIAFTCLLFTLSWFKYELSYDTFYKNSDRVYQLNSHFKSDNGVIWSTTPFALSESLKAFSEVEKISVLDFKSLDLPVENEKTDVKVLKTDGVFYEMFPQSFLIGKADAVTASDIVLTEDFARRNWGTADGAIGKSVGDYIVKGIVKTPPSNTIFPFDALVLRPENEINTADWGNYNFLTFVRLAEKVDGRKFSEKMKHAKLRAEESNSFFEIIPLHLSKHMIEGKTFVQAFGSFIVIIAALLLLLLSALFNFTMLATAGYLAKLKMYALHKTMGASSWQIVKIMYGEIILSLGMVFIISAYLVELCRGPVTLFLDIPLDAAYLFGEFVKYLLICSVLVFLCALYPVVYIRFLALKKMLVGGTQQGGKGKLNTWMIGVQLTVTIILAFFITGTATQFLFMTKAGLGFTVDNIGRINIESDAIKSNIIPFIQDLKANKAIKDVIWSDYDLFRVGGAFSSRDANEFLLLPDFDPDDKREIYFYPMKADVLTFFDIDLVKGRYFTDEEESGMNETVVTQQLANEFGVKDIVGQIKSYDGSPIKVVGIVKDFHCRPMTEPIQPAAFINSIKIKRWGGAGVPSICYFKYFPDRKQEAFDAVREVYGKYAEGYTPAIGLFKDYIQQFYQTEKRMLVLFGIITLVSIFISLIGLFALILFKLYHRRKEIALRKIQGASARQIMYLLLKEYIILMFISCVIALPIVYFSLNYWLSQYQYKEEMSIFTAAGIVLIISAFVFLTIIGQVIKTTKTNPLKVIKENG